MISLVELSYLVASFLFIVGLKRLSSPKTARSGNFVAALGMCLAVVGTFFISGMENFIWIIAAIILGTIPGYLMAKRVEMTSMPQMVSLFNGMGGACALFISIAEYIKHPDATSGSLFGTVLGTIFGAISFTGSIIAYGKLQGLISEKQVRIPMQKMVSILLVATLLLASYLVISNTAFSNISVEQSFYAIIAIGLVMGILQVLPIGGADMPVVISVLNSCTGMAAAVTGFAMENMSMIIAGTLVGAAGSFLTLLMCKAMNRSLANVLFGSFGAGSVAAGAMQAIQGTQREISSQETAMMMAYANKVVIIPGYGLAVAQGQHLVHELEELLEKRGVEVKYAIHPVAGRMPGHMNVLLAESNVPYPKLIDMEEINPEFNQTDVALVIGANDVVNPSARSDKASPIFGMPILDADKSKNIVVMKRGRGVGFAGIENALFFDNKTKMLFGDAKNTLKELVNELKAM